MRFKLSHYRFIEYLETRQAARLVASKPTGVTYPTFRAMEDGTLAKNRALLA